MGAYMRVYEDSTRKPIERESLFKRHTRFGIFIRSNLSKSKWVYAFNFDVLGLIFEIIQLLNLRKRFKCFKSNNFAQIFIHLTTSTGLEITREKYKEWKSLWARIISLYHHSPENHFAISLCKLQNSLPLIIFSVI